MSSDSVQVVGPPTGSMFSLQCELHDGEVRSEDGIVFISIEAAESARLRDERFQNDKPIVRNLVAKPPPIRSPEELKLIWSSLGMSVYPCIENSNLQIPAPYFSFEEAFGDNDQIMAEIKKNGFEKPSAIQSQMWSALMNGKDCVGISQTGSGKTLAFLLPAFLHIDAQYRQYENGETKPLPSVLVLTPTRELALQIEREVEKYLYNNYKSVCVYGGAPIREQIEACSRGAEIVIATPGRLTDFAARGVIDLSKVTYVVLDEADRMLDLGFEPQIKRILVEIRPDRLVALTSATWPDSVQKLTKKYTKNAVMTVVGTLDLSTCKDVKQYFDFLDTDEEKLRRVLELVGVLERSYPNFKLIIFVKSKVLADHLSSDFCLNNINSQGLHGGRSQKDRENSLRDFREGTVRILVATDVASRGLDVPDVTHVLNYDFPTEIEEYVHRVGRTGRAGRKGEAMSFISWRDRVLVNELITVLKKSEQEVPVQLVNMAERYARQVEKYGPMKPNRFRRAKQDNFQAY